MEKAGGIGLIIVVNYDDSLSPSELPAALIKPIDGLTVLDYISKSKNPTAYITEAKEQKGYKVIEAPAVAIFSSVGPSGGSLNIIKVCIFFVVVPQTFLDIDHFPFIVLFNFSLIF